MHSGRKGMKWGQHIFMKDDGTLTSAGKRKYGTKTNYNKVMAAKRAADPKVLKEKAKAQAKREAAEARVQKEIAKYADKKAKQEQKLGIDKKTKPQEAPKPQEQAKSQEQSKPQSQITVNQMPKTSEKSQKRSKELVKSFAKFAAKEWIVPAAADIGRQATKSIMSKYTNQALNYWDPNLEKTFANNKKK